ncbi:hypothetical protein INT48_006019, partial [Thamnidium elegans]
MTNIVIQQELVSLLVVAKKAFSQGRDMCNQANIYQQSSQKYIETIERIHPKLLFVDNHINLQLKDLDNMRDYLDAGAESCKKRIKDRETRLQSLTIELTNIFNLLKECTIDKDILKVNEERGGESQNEVTLFDYISDQEIIELQRLADDEIGEIEASKKTKITQLGPEECEKLDITILKTDDDSLQNIIEELRIGLDVVIFTSEEIYDRMQVYLHAKEELAKVLNQLDQIGLSVEAIYDKLLYFESEIKERENNLDEFFEQLKSLVEWYRCYASSYNYLLLEIDRRKNAQEKQDQLRNELLKSFEAAYNDELQERRSWSAQHGQYLPEVLCPFIKDAPSILTVAIESDVVTRLPNLSRSSVEK